MTTEGSPGETDCSPIDGVRDTVIDGYDCEGEGGSSGIEWKDVA
jgi:hypothetical protein